MDFKAAIHIDQANSGDTKMEDIIGREKIIHLISTGQ